MFLHWSGPRTPVVKRGQWNSVGDAMDKLLSSCGRYHLEMNSVTRQEDTEPELVIEQIKEVIVSDVKQRHFLDLSRCPSRLPKMHHHVRVTTRTCLASGRSWRR